MSVFPLDPLHTLFDAKYEAAESDAERYDVEKARAVVTVYCLHYTNDGYVTRGIETPFSLPVWDFDTKAMSDDRRYGGIIDAIVEARDGVFLADHKTASQVSPSTWIELETNPQLSLYFTAAMQCGLEPKFLWDVIVKPGISPKQLTKADIKEIHEEGTYQGQPTNEQVEYGDKETPKLYGTRVLVQYTETPEKYFHRRKVVRTRDEVLEFAKLLDQITKDLKACEKGELPIYPNHHACKRFGTMCDFHKICSGRSSIDDTAEYKVREKVDSDRKLAGNAISNSQMGTFMSCRQEWKFRYVDRIEPVNREYKESLNFGSLVHEALEVFLGSRWGDSKVTFPNGEEGDG